MILYFATILLALDCAITIVSSQKTSDACFDAISALRENRDCYNALTREPDSNSTEESINNADLQIYCSSSCRSIIARFIQFCVSCI